MEDEDQVPTLDNLIRRIREERKLNQEEFGDVIGVSDSFVALVETGRRSMGEATMNRTIKALKLSERDADLLRRSRQTRSRELSSKQPSVTTEFIQTAAARLERMEIEVGELRQAVDRATLEVHELFELVRRSLLGEP